MLSSITGHAQCSGLVANETDCDRDAGGVVERCLGGLVAVGGHVFCDDFDRNNRGIECHAAIFPQVIAIAAGDAGGGGAVTQRVARRQVGGVGQGAINLLARVNRSHAVGVGRRVGAAIVRKVQHRGDARRAVCVAEVLVPPIDTSVQDGNNHPVACDAKPGHGIVHPRLDTGLVHRVRR